jgi:hypothetical protein
MLFPLWSINSHNKIHIAFHTHKPCEKKTTTFESEEDVWNVLGDDDETPNAGGITHTNFNIIP